MQNLIGKIHRSILYLLRTYLGGDSVLLTKLNFDAFTLDDCAIIRKNVNAMFRINRWNLQIIKNCRRFVTNTSLLKMKKDLTDEVSGNVQESPRIKQFHEKLKLQPIPKIKHRERFIDLVLVETDSRTGELITNSEKNPTKWGDWQHGGRVSDF